ncbi:helix-turn-helix domain-containing protein [Mesorhizobium sp. BR1-1-16]|uniref:helix-turn-helix domain-containing protein n=1 Tax=Mesorhizobium sp. BR1-1-16 TaxID=2876653 RepID=UPI001CCB9BFB|nr:helix-turn-helix domain-containing protein [Mesorhizobium sp. BR1-1-16]MBZ9939158.1 helix-turn-helix domain-containing protein [Mesorhizobium sp. BR1-1-16]
MSTSRMAVDLPTNTVQLGVMSVQTTPTVAELIHCLAEVAPRPVTLERLIAKLSGWHEPMEAVTLRVHISRARNMVRPLGAEIINIRAKGWYLKVPA